MRPAGHTQNSIYPRCTLSKICFQLFSANLTSQSVSQTTFYLINLAKNRFLSKFNDWRQKRADPWSKVCEFSKIKNLNITFYCTNDNLFGFIEGIVQLFSPNKFAIPTEKMSEEYHSFTQFSIFWNLIYQTKPTSYIYIYSQYKKELSILTIVSVYFVHFVKAYKFNSK